ncbi:MAG TPA: phage tail tape measure protein [Parapedobacter sp.]|uniref:phage tail tape measure protein n=1 Tax=Parapedobacter sp. TaxID=1958893 RepID=UPI002BB9B7EA|nr:phage tail tape measure protein [Parapedobacter sp.]HWK58748.1 phage tail tape measure protein [Parapedobacter sp.]
MAKTRTDTESVLKLVINGQQAKASAKEIEDSWRKVRAELKNMREEDNPRLYAEKTKQVEKLKQALDESRRALNGNATAAKTFKSSMQDIAKGVFAGNMYQRGFDLLVKGVTGFITKNAELSDIMGGVMKTTGLTGDAVDRLNERFKKFDSRTANTQLMNLAQVAGKLGITAERDVEGFVRAADRIGVALGEDLGGVEESINSLGKLTDIFKLKDRFGIEESLMRVGSAINTLGASGTAAEKNLVDFAQRMAGIAPAAGISLPAVLGLAATADELGQSMESSSTAIGQFILQLGKDVPKYAKIAGMSVADFSKLLREDAMEAFTRVLEGSKTAGGGVAALAKNMGVMEVSGARGVAALGALAERTDLLRRRVQEGAEAFDENTSIMAEFNNMNTTLAANLEKIQNRLAQLWEHSGLRQWFTDLTGALVDNRSAVEKAIGEYENARSEMRAMDRDLVPLIDRYEELTAKGELTEAEHQELHKIIVKLSEEYPIAISQVDAYGNALAMNTDILRGNVEEHRNYLRFINEKAIAEAKDHQAELKRRKERIESVLNERKVTEFQGLSAYDRSGGQLVTRDMTNEELKAKRAELEDVVNDIRALDTQMGMLGEDTLGVFRQIEGKYSQGALDSVEKITKRIEELTEARKNADAGSQAYMEAEAGIAQLTARLDAMNGGDAPGGTGGGGKTKEQEKAEKDAERKREKAKKDYEKLLNDFGALDAARLLDLMGKSKREVEESNAKYQKLIDQHRDFLKQEGVTDEQRAEIEKKIGELEVNQKTASDAIKVRQEKEYLAKIESLRVGLANKHASELDKEKARINAFYDKLVDENRENAEVVEDLNKARARDITDAEIREAERLKREKERLEAEYLRGGMSGYEKRLADINAKYDAEVEALRKKYNQELQLSQEFQDALAAIDQGRRDAVKALDEEELEKKIELAVRGAEIISDAVFQISGNNRKAESDAKLEQLRKEREAELSNKSLTETQKKAINDKYDKLEKAEKRRAWQAQKKADIAQAIIATALGVAKSIPNWIQMGIAAAAGAAQVAIISAQKPPTFGKGGMVPDGSSHAQGGIDLWDRRRRRIIGNIEGGEPILSRETYRNNREIVDELLYSSMRRDGAAIRLNPDLIDADRAVRNGGSVAARVEAPVVNVAAPNVDLRGLENVVGQLVDVVQDAEGRPVVISYRALQDANERVGRITNGVDA